MNAMVPGQRRGVFSARYRFVSFYFSGGGRRASQVASASPIKPTHGIQQGFNPITHQIGL
jgi:hypothetical protein